MGMNAFSDYGSGSSLGSEMEHEFRSQLPGRRLDKPKQKSASFVDLMMGRCTLGDVMKEFRMNGSDSPYYPDEEIWVTKPDPLVSGSSGGVSYLRQQSWPAPEQTPRPPLPRHALGGGGVPATVNEPIPASLLDTLTEEQRRVLTSLPDDAVYTLLREMEMIRGKKRFDECRFCMNNGELESFYRSHSLKDAVGRVSCPVLRAYQCRRCGARGDGAHTAKYCPLATHDDRMKSDAIMRSVRMASGKRRNSYSGGGKYVLFGETPSGDWRENSLWAYEDTAPLDPQWAALEKKLLL